MDRDLSAATRQLVFGDDASPGSDVAWLWINSQTWPGWRLTMVAADPPAFGIAVATDESAPHPVAGDAPRPLYSEPGFADTEFLTASADPRVVLTSFDDASLVVLGTASGGLGRRHIGSTAEWCLHDPAAPTVIARRGRPVARAVVCADGSAHALAAASSLASMPWVDQVAVEAVAVDDGRTDCDAALAAVTEVLADVVSDINGTVRSGRPHHEILEHTHDHDADLVVLGSHGLTMMRRVLLGSTASAVTRLAASSVLVARGAVEPATG